MDRVKLKRGDITNSLRFKIFEKNFKIKKSGWVRFIVVKLTRTKRVILKAVERPL